MSRILFCLLLICLCTTASAREMRQGAGSDDGSCPEIAAAVAEAEANAPVTKPRAAAPTRTKSGKVSGARGDAQRVQAPRWHSFLPGMFR